MSKNKHLIDIVNAETTHADNVKHAILENNQDVFSESEKHQNRMKLLEKERLASQNWNEKNEITQRLQQLATQNPMKYLRTFENLDEPYFGSVFIEDENPKIGKQKYYFGKQPLTHKSKVVIIDWREAAITCLYYEYTVDEEYGEDINGVEREGLILDKRQYAFRNRTLHKIQKEDLTLQCTNGTWSSSCGKLTSAEKKKESGNHQLVDIVALISPEQFQIITKQHQGCTYLTGGAGSGKTTVALHRLSCLQYNYKEKFRGERCLVVMFNRPLCEYIKCTTKELLDKQTAITTYSSWAAQAVKSYGIKSFQCKGSEATKFERLKKHASFSKLIVSIAKKSKFTKDINCAKTLFELYTSLPKTSEELEPDFKIFRKYYTQKLKNADYQLSFSDVSIILRLLQLQTPRSVQQSAHKWYDHILIDEAQDFSQIELETLQAATHTNSLTVCADDKQRILAFVDGNGFNSFQTKLLKSGTTSETLTINYRSSDAIMEIAAAVRGSSFEKSGRRGEEIQLWSKTNNSQLLLQLRKRLTTLKKQDPNSLIAVICKTKKDVKNIANYLTANSKVSFITELQKFDFKANIVLTNVHQVKGLEFTHVFLWEPSALKYRRTEIDQNLLYVALTRACQTLEIFHNLTTRMSSYLLPFFEDKLPKQPRRRL